MIKHLGLTCEDAMIVILGLSLPLKAVGRDATIVADWLRKQPTVTHVARDHAGAYSDAVETANQDAQQIADRWHLLSNLREAVERLLIRQAPRLRQAAYSSSEALQMQSQPVTADTRATVLPLASWQRLSIDRRAARMACYEEAVRRRQLGESFKAIGHATNLDHRTVRNFVQAGSFPERAQRASGSTLLDGHRHYMASRVAEGCLSAAHVWQELRARGFAGSRSTVRDSMARARAAGSDGAGLSSKAPTVACPSPSRGLRLASAHICQPCLADFSVSRSR